MCTTLTECVQDKVIFFPVVWNIILIFFFFCAFNFVARGKQVVIRVCIENYIYEYGPLGYINAWQYHCSTHLLLPTSIL